jgi:peptide/nickel transport system substrate-binding protein
MKSIIKRKTACIAGLLVLFALLCAGMQMAMAAEQTLTIGIGGRASFGTDPTLDSAIWPDIGGLQEHHHYTHFSPLITLDSNSNIIPWMAEAYEVSDDYKTITFHLRKGVKFADGTPLNASILKFNFDRVEMYGMEDFGKNRTKQNLFLYYGSSEAPDEYTFKIHFTTGWVDMPFELALNSVYGLSAFISPQDVNPVWDIKGMLKPEKKYNGLGAYYVEENESTPKEKVVLKKRNSWRDDLSFHKPVLDKIVLTYIADPQTAVMALEKGDIDFICRGWNAPLDTLPNLEKNPDVIIKTGSEVRTYFLNVAHWKEPFNGTDGILLRKAICYALNRTDLSEGAFSGYALPATDCMDQSPKRPDVPECCGKGYDYDLDKAKQLLAEAGWNDTDGDGILDKNGKALKNLDFVTTSDPSLSWQRDLSVLVQSQLKRIGIDAKIRTLEWGDYKKNTNEGGFDLKIGYNMGNGIALSNDLNGYNLKSRRGSKVNLYENQNGTLEKITDITQKTANKEERDKCMCQICNILYEEAGVIPLVHPAMYAVMNRKVNGFELGPSETFYYLDHVDECRVEN